MHATKAVWRVLFQKKKNILHLLPRLTKILASDRSSPCTRQRHYGWYFSRTLVHARYKGGMEDTFFCLRNCAARFLSCSCAIAFRRFCFSCIRMYIVHMSVVRMSMHMGVLHTYVYCIYGCGVYEYVYGCRVYEYAYGRLRCVG